MSGFLRISILLFSLVATQAWAAWGEIDEVTVTPSAPTDRSLIGITVTGQKSDPCQIIEHSYTLTENKISIEITTTSDPLADCAQVVTPFEFTQTVGSLSAGEYSVEVAIVDTEAMAETSFTVSEASGGLTLSPPTGAYISEQAFDFAMILESGAAVTTGSAYLSGQDTGSEQWIDVSAELAACLQVGTLAPEGSTYRCPGLSAMLEAGSHTLIVSLTLNDGTVVSDAVNWTILGATE